MHRKLGDRWRAASVLEALAETLRRAGPGKSRGAAVLLGAAGAIRAAIGAPVPAVERTDWERTYGALQAELGEPELLAAITEGHDRDLDSVVSTVLQITLDPVDCSIVTTSPQPEPSFMSAGHTTKGEP
jgi:hypothetical protein